MDGKELALRDAPLEFKSVTNDPGWNTYDWDHRHRPEIPYGQTSHMNSGIEILEEHPLTPNLN